jgi:RNA polymerase sigma factor (sigma-70 family)
MPEPSTAELVRAAAADDQSAWNTLVRRYAGVVWAVAREHGLSAADAADVSQTTWLNLSRRLAGLRDPERLAGWLATTARREARRAALARARETPVDWLARCSTGGEQPSAPAPDQVVLAADADHQLWRAFAELSHRCRQLLRLVALAPELSYAQAARALGIQLGSVGPVRGRCLATLRRKLRSAGVLEGVRR